MPYGVLKDSVSMETFDNSDEEFRLLNTLPSDAKINGNGGKKKTANT